MEIWKKINGFEDYKISNLGNIRLLNGGISKRKITDKYSQIGLIKENKSHTFYIHRLVALHFIANPENKPEVNHINGIKSDNRVENLEWVTAFENIRHAISLGKLDSYYKNKSENMKKYYKNNPIDKGRAINFHMRGFMSRIRTVLNLETGIYYDTIKEASESTNLKYGTFKSMIYGKNKNKTNCILLSK